MQYNIDTDLIKKLCGIHAPSGEEDRMRDFVVDYVKQNQHKWNAKPEILYGEEWQNCVLLKFGTPRTAVFAHMDNIGFTVRYQNQLIPIGGPEAETGYKLKGNDDFGPIECEIEVNENNQTLYKFGRGIQAGTSLSFSCDFRESDDYIQSCYLDNRLGVYTALKLAETLENGVIAFSCREEHGGGSVPFLARYIYEQLNVRQCLVADITWVTEGVHHGNGVVISMRDRGIPQRAFLNKIIDIAQNNGADFQFEVEAGGSSDARELQASPYPLDWCFIGAPEDHVHSPDEMVHKNDLEAMINLYKLLMETL